jgi:NERD domain protein
VRRKSSGDNQKYERLIYMARMIPQVETDEDFNGSVGEQEVYEALQQKLPSDCLVFHSIAWQSTPAFSQTLWGEADFIVYLPQYGILVIEVKAGAIHCEDNKIIQENRRSHEQHEVRPLVQANNTKFKLIIPLLKEKRIGKEVCVQPAVWFTSVTKEQIHGKFPPPYQEHMILTRENLSNPMASLRDVCAHYNMRIHTPSKAYGEIILKGLAPVFHAIPSASTLAAENERIFFRMTRQQARLIDYLDEVDYAVIQGAAGTGKTMLAVEKARSLNERNEPVLFLVFNKYLSEYLEQMYGDELRNVTFATIYMLVYQSLRRNITDRDIRQYLESISKTDRWPYRHIIIDEGQDFAEWNTQLYELAKKHRGCCYIFFDKNQLVQKRDQLDWLHHFECRLKLSKNCRNTKRIAETAICPIPCDPIQMRIESSALEGEQPKLFIFNEESAYVAGIGKIIRYYEKQGFRPNQITILTLKTMEQSPLTKELQYADSHLSEVIAQDISTEHVSFTTARKFKGLESDVVILIDGDAQTFSSDEGRRLFYVGASRGKHLLSVVVLLPYGEEDELASALDGKGVNSRLRIMNGLKVVVADVKGL